MSQSIIEITADYEEWFADHTHVVQRDLTTKHANMASSDFLFLRATFYAWIKRFLENCPHLVDKSIIEVNSVGDLHVDNYGSWRDFEGRLPWGVNDFDEAFLLPWTFDLVRLATSHRLAIAEDKLQIVWKDGCEAILEGYVERLSRGGRGFVLGEDNLELREMVLPKLRVPHVFWSKLDSQLTRLTLDAVPKAALAALAEKMPEPKLKLKWRFGHRTAGQGSLGRPRIVSIAEFNGGKIAREAKIALPSACVWAGLAKDGDDHNRYNEVLQAAFRSPDPILGVYNGWTIRRLSPDCSRIELSDLPRDRDEHLLLRSMGADAANIHLGTKGSAPKILAQLKDMDPKWLVKAVKTMTKVTREDRAEWADYQNSRSRKRR